MPHLPTRLLIAAMLGFSSFASGLETSNPDLRINGFATLGVTKAGSEQLGARNFVSEEGVFNGDWSPKLDSKIGLQVNYTASPTFAFNLQFMLQDKPSNSLEESIRSAYVDVTLNPELTLRVGRLLTDIYMLSEYRDVGFAQLWTHPPAEFYGHVPSAYADGTVLIHSININDGLLRTRAWYANSKYSFISASTHVDADLKPTFGFSTTWESADWQLRATYSKAKYNGSRSSTYGPVYDYLRGAVNLGWPEAPAIADYYDRDAYWLNYYTLGAAYTKRGWTVQAEASRIETQLNNYDAAYILIGKRFDNITPYVSAAWSENDRVTIDSAPPWLSELQGYAQNLADAYHVDQRTVSIGTRWDVTHSIAIKAQWDRTRVGDYGGFLYEQKSPAQADTLNRFTLAVDFLF